MYIYIYIYVCSRAFADKSEGRADWSRDSVHFERLRNTLGEMTRLDFLGFRDALKCETKKTRHLHLDAPQTRTPYSKHYRTRWSYGMIDDDACAVDDDDDHDDNGDADDDDLPGVPNSGGVKITCS